ncbi:Hypothetical protein IALB_2139 [Ignavibacterium album JCM 16511]|uniref:Uncharacterized protein n=1 Tax=Ignavibacterium album (strain DSM 19864 / JCM 16511 / NBRC 101810 / Mat9-16) TaxID=945713 RepID=I0ALI7_IGNAJ|nr:hypothetical protein [Ignavibacterium album]AFH49844.1 Hypothetical protein IALB_2139 [Ignavibacterium album JCM 16511]
MKKLIIIVLTIFITHLNFAQSEDTTQQGIEIFLIDAYCKPDTPHPFILSFYTDVPAKSKVILEKKYEFDVSKDFSEMHNIQIDITKLTFTDKQVQFVIQVEDSLGNRVTSETFDFDLPYEPVITGGSSLLTLCLFGGFVFLLPTPNYVIQNNQSYFSLTKEIPFLSFRSKSFRYPASYFAIELTYIFKTEDKKFFRMSYKRLFELPVIEYVAPGIGGYTNFAGNNGIAPEFTVGLFRLFDTFTIFTRYRYNFQPSGNKSHFHEINLGLYSGFFSIYL